jgi:hypothetical protein
LKSCAICQSNELARTKRKLAKYEQAVKLLMDESIIQEAYVGPDDSSKLYESVILTKNKEGEIEKKHTSNLGESYIIIDKAKDINQLNNKEKYAIDEQNNYRNYEIAKQYANKGTYYYGVLGFATRVAGFFIGLF